MSSVSKLVSNNDLKSKVELFITLNEEQLTSNNYRINLQLLNNKSISTDLGNTELSNKKEVSEYKFSTTYMLDYYFEMEQKIKVGILNETNSLIDTKDCSLGNIVGNRNNTLKLIFNNMSITIKAIKVQNEKTNVQLNVSCPLFPNNKGRIFYVISNSNDDIKWRRVYKSEERGPKENFDILEVDSSALCLGNFNKKMNIEFFSSNSIPLGNVFFNVNQCIDTQMLVIDLGAKDSDVRNYTPHIDDHDPNKIKVPITVVINTRFDFIDYLSQGMQINMIVSVDCTASNGRINDPNSLHYIDYNRLNDYELSIKHCGSIVAYYDYDQKFPIFGFGGIPPNRNSVEHIFPLNFNYNGSPEVNSIDEMLFTYRNSISKVTLYGPTCFAPTIRKTIDVCKQNNMSSYFILLILTDGMITDQDDTISAIIDASRLPISIIIIGIGSADFSNMEILDGDDIPLSNEKGIVERDIVQFVEFSKYKNRIELLAEEVLKEVPRQVEDYYRGKKINFC